MTDIKVPPHDIEAEQRVLGGILINNDRMEEVIKIVSVDDFYRTSHAKIYNAMINLWRVKEIDLITLMQELYGESKDEITSDYVAMLAEETHDNMLIVKHARTLRYLSQQRTIRAYVASLLE